MARDEARPTGESGSRLTGYAILQYSIFPRQGRFMTHSNIRLSVLPRLLAVTGLLALGTLYAIFVWTNSLNDLGGDSAAYLIISRLYSPYHTASLATLAYKNGIITPPLFPLILALFDGGFNFLVAHLVVAAFALASSVALYFWLRAESITVWTSLAASIVFAILPATMLMTLNIWTEFPYLFFSLAATAMVARYTSESTSSLRYWYAAAVLVACATMIRVASLPLLGAFLVYLLIKRPRHFLVMAGVAALPFIIWAGYSSHSETGAGAYVNHFVNVYSGDPVNFLMHQIQTEYQAVYGAWTRGWIGAPTSETLRQLVRGFWFLSIAGWLYRLIGLKFDALYTFLYIVLLFMWPHPEEAPRYSFVLYPFLIANAFLLVRSLVQRIPGKFNQSALFALVIGIMLICAAPSAAFIVKRYFADVPEEVADARHTQDWYGEQQFATISEAYFRMRLFANIKEIVKFVPPGECVFAIKPTVVQLLSDRAAFGPPKISESDTQFNEQIKKCRFAYVLPFASPSYGTTFYPVARLGDRVKVLSKAEDEAGNRDGELIEIVNSGNANPAAVPK